MSEKNVINSKLNELLHLIDDHKKGLPMSTPEKHHQNKKKKIDYSDFSLILSGGDDDFTTSNKPKKKKETRNQPNHQKQRTKSKSISSQQKSKSKKLSNHQKIKPKSHQNSLKKAEVLQEEEIVEKEHRNNDLSIHCENLHKIITECKNLDSIIEASLSPKPVKNRSTKKNQDHEKNESNSNHSPALLSQEQNDSLNTPSKSSNNSRNHSKSSKTPQDSQNRNISSTPSLKSSNNSRKESVGKQPESSHNSNPQPDIAIIDSTSSQVYVVEQATQTHYSNTHTSEAISQNISKSQQLLDTNDEITNRNINDIIFEEEEEAVQDFSDLINLESNSSQEERPNQTMTNAKEEPSPTQNYQIKTSSDLINQPRQLEDDDIVLNKIKTKSVTLNDQEDSNIDNSNLSSNHLQQSSETSSSDVSIEAISNSSDENAGKVIQSPVKMNHKKTTEFLEAIIITDSESEKKKQKKKQPPPEIIIPESHKLKQNNNNINDNDILECSDIDENVLEILATSSNSDEQEKNQPPNVIYSSPTTPKSAKTIYLKPIISSESESKHTTDTDKEKEERAPKPVPIYSNAEEEEEIISNSREIELLKKKVINNDLLNNIQSSESNDDINDLILLHTTDSSDDL